MLIKIKQNVLEANDKKAAELRAKLNDQKILMVNLISSPGSGKTSLLEKSLPMLTKKFRVAVIEGDVETEEDAKRLEKFNVKLALINTHGSCHLESVSIEKALGVLDLSALDLIIVENVGNLVCPAEFDIGEDFKIALISTSEGEDKVIKYPLLFRSAALVVLNKIDLLAYLPFVKERFYQYLNDVNKGIEVVETSCQNAIGIDEWVNWLEKKIIDKQTGTKP